MRANKKTLLSNFPPIRFQLSHKPFNGTFITSGALFAPVTARSLMICLHTSKSNLDVAIVTVCQKLDYYITDPFSCNTLNKNSDYSGDRFIRWWWWRVTELIYRQWVYLQLECQQGETKINPLPSNISCFKLTISSSFTRNNISWSN